MQRYRAHCNVCHSYSTAWVDHESSAVADVQQHIQYRHATAYRAEGQRQCDYDHEPYYGTCRVCGHDFCSWHRGAESDRCNQH